jgi:predicted Fe-Mo cluster-binding NifX family protein
MKKRKERIWRSEMACWKWFDGVLKEAGVKVTDKNRQKVDEVIHHYIGEQSSYGRCSADWRKARKEILDDEAMKKELIKQLRMAV